MIDKLFNELTERKNTLNHELVFIEKLLKLIEKNKEGYAAMLKSAWKSRKL